MGVRFLLFPALMVLVLMASAQEKVTFQDHVLPVVEANCAKCHNSDKKKGDLDLTSYSATLAGGASGKVVVSGDADASKVWKVINHLEDPSMPPNRGKMNDKELGVFRKWIAGGLLETLTSKAITSKPSADLTLKVDALGKPEGPPPMPGDLLMESLFTAKRPGAVTGLAASPWAPLIAVAGQKDVALYHSESLELLGLLPFQDEQGTYQPGDVKFSHNGKLLVVGGGHAAKAGRIIVFDITTGERVISVGSGQEFDSALGADISPDQSRIAFGGPSKVLKIFSTQDGALLHKMKKHTDWVTAVAYSPNGDWLASADRNGAIVIWDADNGLEIHTLAGHKTAVTGLSWRPDSKVLASVSDDGSAKVWEMNEGKQVKTWNPHPAGALSVDYALDGRLVTCGRDNQVVAWNAEGGKLKSFEFTNELPVRVAFTQDGGRVAAVDWHGKMTVWNATDGKRVIEMPASPPTISQQIATIEQRLAELRVRGPGSSPAQNAADEAVAEAAKEVEKLKVLAERARATLAPKEAEAARLKAQVLTSSTPELVARHQAARATRNEARLAVTNAVAALETRQAVLKKLQSQASSVAAIDPAKDIEILNARLARLKAAQVYTSVFRTRESVAAKKREQEKMVAAGGKPEKAAADKLAKQIAKEEKELEKHKSDFERLKAGSISAKAPGRQSKI